MKLLGLSITMMLVVVGLTGCQQSAAVAADPAEPVAATPATPAVPATPVVAPTAGVGSISGHVDYGGEPAPAMHVCAIGIKDKSQVGCVRTQPGQADYRIDGLAPGDYAVYGWFHDGDKRVIRARQVIMCIRAPCPQGEPIVISLAAGDHYSRAHLNDAAKSFPGMPAEPATD